MSDYRKLMDQSDPWFWGCRKQYLLAFDEDEMEIVEWLVWQAYQRGLKDNEQ